MADTSTPNTTKSTEPAEPAKDKYRLTARFWQQPKFDKDGKVVGHTLVHRGALVELTEDEAEQLNVFKPSFEKVDE